jgi:hypothetical protein
MKTNPQIFHGEWWVPAVADYNTCMNFPEPEQMMGLEKKYTGTLTYSGDGDITLELYHVLSNFRFNSFGQNRVMWGRDSNGHVFTLFNAQIVQKRMADFSSTKYVVGLVLMGEHVLSVEDTRFKSCEVHFPYLRNWAFQNNINHSNTESSICFEISHGATNLLDTINDDGARLRLWQGKTIERTIHDLTIIQTTNLEIEAERPLSLKSYFEQIEEFAQFLSIALYGDQNPTEIKFINKESGRESILLFKKDASVNPGVFTLIKFDSLKDKLPAMLNQWHNNFDKIAPISSYLIDSLQKKSRFDVPDFLIIAQALDGYHKRFVNKKDGKDHQKYEDGIKILLEQFEDVDCIQKCNINPTILKDSRNFYSHLSPDEEKKSAVEGGDLYWLTEKCKVLLTCCILNLLGLTNKEINLCCENSPISQIIDSLPLELE